MTYKVKKRYSQYIYDDTPWLLVDWEQTCWILLFHSQGPNYIK